MKCKIILISFLILILSFPSVWCSDQPNPKIWEPLNNNFYYNKKIITQSPGLLMVWTYKTITDDLRKKTMEDVNKYDPDNSLKYKDYHHETVLWEIDCHQKLIRTEEFIDFDRTGKVIGRNRHNSSEWNNIFPKTGGDALYQKVCLPQKEPLKKKKRK